MRLLHGVVLLTSLLVSQAHAEGTTLLVAFGDSLTAGYGVAPEDAFPVQLEERLKKDGYNVSILNQGISGDTSAGGTARVDQVIDKNPRMVILQLGGNDLLRGLPIADTKNNLSVIMKRLKEANIKIFLVGQKAPINMGIKYAAEYNSMFPELAKKYDAALYPNFLEFVFGDSTMMQEDGIHPNKAGVEVIANKIAPLVEHEFKK